MNKLVSIIRTRQEVLDQKIAGWLEENPDRKSFIEYWLKLKDKFWQILIRELDREHPKNNLSTFIKKSFPQKETLIVFISLLFYLRELLINLKSREVFVKYETNTRHFSELIDQTVLVLVQSYIQQIEHDISISHKYINDLKIIKSDQQKHLNLLYQFIKSVPVGMAGCNKNSEVVLWNPMAVRLSGYSQSDILQKSILSIFDEMERNKLKEEVTPTAKRIKRLRCKINIKNGGHLMAWVYINHIIYPEFGDIDYIIIFGDLKYQELLQSHKNTINQLKAISRLSASIMHDIRNPINAIALNLDVIDQYLKENMKYDSTVSQIMNKINRQIDQLNLNLNHYLSYSKIAEIRPQLIRLDLFLNEWLSEKVKIEETVSVKKTGMRDKTYIKADWPQLERVFNNIWQNAIDAMDGRGQIRIQFTKQHSRIRISFTDAGSGIPEHLLKQVFDPYFSTKGSGMGMGMFIAREIIRAHKGRIYLKSTPGYGTRVTISLALADTRKTGENILPDDNKEVINGTS